VQKDRLQIGDERDLEKWAGFTDIFKRIVIIGDILFGMTEVIGFQPVLEDLAAEYLCPFRDG
jgi:hypothetical protein